MDFFTNLLLDAQDTVEYTSMLMPALLQGTWWMIKLFFWTLIFAIPLGLPLTLGSICRIAPIRWFCKGYIAIFRGTPLLLQLFFFYFTLAISFDIRLDVFHAVVMAFALNYAAYLAEIYRGGIESIERGQYEAAHSLGLSKAQTMVGIILPQTFRRILPAVTNEAVILVKDTALASVIGVAELMKVARGIMNRDTSTWALLLAAVIYFLFTLLITILAKHLERRASRHEIKED